MKAIDIVNKEPKTELELWARWLNNMQGEVLTAPWTPRKKIEIKYITDEPVNYYVPTLRDYSVGGGKYMDGNGDYITKEEALAEIEWQAGRNKLYVK